MELHPKHFSLLRLAKLRALKLRHIGGEVFAVTSFTRVGTEWVVSAGVCSCPAKSYCSHLALATDYYFTNLATPLDYSRYAGERAADRAEFMHRINTGTLTKNDRTYLKACVRFAERRREAVKVGIRRVESRGKVREFCGAFQI